MNASVQNTGLFFGSFNPVHNGHLEIARYMLSNEGLDEIWFVVSPQNPLKESEELVNAQQRLEMMKLAALSDPRFKVSDVEFTMPRPSFTYHTLERLSANFPEKQFYLIIGSDNLEELSLWKNHKLILQNYKLLVYPRKKEIGGLFTEEPNIRITHAPLLNISSTEIRGLYKSGQDASHLVNPDVHRYIVNNRLYIQ
jgi:nicotinate-nucleotide adenylyltransferase